MRLDKEQHEKLEAWLRNPEFIDWANEVQNIHYFEWENYFNNNPKERRTATFGKLIVEGVKFKSKPLNQEIGLKALERLKANVERDRVDELVIKPRQSHGFNYKPWTIAASFFIVFSFSIYGYFQVSAPQIVVVATEYGERKKIDLPDGSKVTLNANSTLSYNRSDVRNVTLVGEAFFDIEKQPETNAPFNVKTSDLDVVVLGTEFNVNTRNEQTEVFLKEGKVNLQVDDDTRDKIEMKPGDLVIYSKKLDKLEEVTELKSEVEIESWKSGILLFSEEPIIEVLSELEEVYGIKFTFETDELEKETLSGGVPSNSLEITLEALSDMFGLQFKIENGMYLVSAKND